MKWYRIIVIALAVVLTALPLFINLAGKPIRLFDESRLAVNAYEMYRSGNMIVTTFNGEPDMWNTKPPLMIWLQVLFMKLIGVSEWAVRLPAAMAAFICCLWLLWFSLRYARDPLPGLISALVLVTSMGFMEQHCAVTGDYDSLMTMFIFFYGLFFFIFIENGDKKYLFLTFLFIALAVLTKGVAGLLMLPGMAVYALVRKRALTLLTNRHFYLGLIMMVLLAGWYYLVRELRNPGYLEAMAGNELWGRYLQPLDQGDKGYGYYFSEIRNFYFKHWIIWLLPAFVIGLFAKRKVLRRIVLYSAIMSVLFFLVITLSKTRYYWYPMPMYPFLALIMGIGIYTLLCWVTTLSPLRRSWISYLFIAVVLSLIFYKPYRQMVTRQFKAEEYGWEAERYNHVYYLRDALRGKHDLDGVEYVSKDYRANARFYICQLQEQGVDIRISERIEDAHFEGKVMAFQQEVKDYIAENYTFELIDTYKNVSIFEIHGEKEVN